MDTPGGPPFNPPNAPNGMQRDEVAEDEGHGELLQVQHNNVDPEIINDPHHPQDQEPNAMDLTPAPPSTPTLPSEEEMASSMRTLEQLRDQVEALMHRPVPHSNTLINLEDIADDSFKDLLYKFNTLVSDLMEKVNDHRRKMTMLGHPGDTEMTSTPASYVLTLAKYTRMFEYRAHKKEFWAIPDRAFVMAFEYSDNQFQDLQVVVASRIYWLNLQTSQDKTVDYGVENYKSRYSNIYPGNVLARGLKGKNEWIRNQNLADNLTWKIFIIAIAMAQLMVRQDHQEMLDSMLEQLHVPPQTPPPVESFTTPYTTEAMASDEPECSICLFNFDHQLDNELHTEPAVKLPCGHVLGSACVSRWVTEGHHNCPFCRRMWIPYEYKLPIDARQHYHNMLEALQKLKSVDEGIDEVLTGGFEECPGEKFRQVLKEVQGPYKELMDAMEQICQALSTQSARVE